MSIELPTSKIPAAIQDPRNLIIFGKSKIGKSTALAALPNALIIDLESGYAYIEAMKVECKNLTDIGEVCKAIKKAGNPYKFIVLDTITALEDMVKPLALKMFKETPAGSKFTGDDVLDAAMGAGYSYLRKAMETVIDSVSKCAPNIILVCHVKDAAIANSDVTVKQIDLLGKTGRVLSSKSDAIGYLTRDEDSNTILSFNSNDKFVECGSRPEHLRNKDVILGEMQEDGSIIYHWDRIYKSLENKD